jgi:hypothetical protein
MGDKYIGNSRLRRSLRTVDRKICNITSAFEAVIRQEGLQVDISCNSWRRSGTSCAMSYAFQQIKTVQNSRANVYRKQPIEEERCLIHIGSKGVKRLPSVSFRSSVHPSSEGMIHSTLRETLRLLKEERASKVHQTLPHGKCRPPHWRKRA